MTDIFSIFLPDPGESLMGQVDKGGNGGDGIVFGFGFSFGLVIVLLRDAERGEGCVIGIL